MLLEEWVPRVAGIEQAGPARRVRSNFANGIKEAPIRVTLG